MSMNMILLLLRVLYVLESVMMGDVLPVLMSHHMDKFVGHSTTVKLGMNNKWNDNLKMVGSIWLRIYIMDRIYSDKWDAGGDFDTFSDASLIYCVWPFTGNVSRYV